MLLPLPVRMVALKTFGLRFLSFLLCCSKPVASHLMRNSVRLLIINGFILISETFNHLVYNRPTEDRSEKLFIDVVHNCVEVDYTKPGVHRATISV